MIHDDLGGLRELKDGGWGLTVELPAFQPFYERWYNDASERLDTRDEGEKAGRFFVNLNAIGGVGPGKTQVQPPSGAQVAAVAYLKTHQARIAEAVKAALVEQAPLVFHWDYLMDGLSEQAKALLATPDRMMQSVELQSLVVGIEEEDGIAQVGFSFHSEWLEPEHGVSVIMHRDQPVLVGTWDDLMNMEGFDDDEDEDGLGELGND